MAKSCAACMAASAAPSGLLRCMAWASTASHGAICRSLGRSGIRRSTAPAASWSPRRPQFADPLEGGPAVRRAFGAGRLRRVRRAGHDVDRVLLPAAGAAGVQQVAGHALGDDQVAGVDRPALRDVHVARVVQLRGLLKVGAGHEELRATTGPALCAADTTASRSKAPWCHPSIRIVSRLASVCPSASMRVLSRARTRSPVPGRVAVRERDLIGAADVPRSISRSRASRASSAPHLVGGGQQQRVLGRRGGR